MGSKSGSLFNFNNEVERERQDKFVLVNITFV